MVGSRAMKVWRVKNKGGNLKRQNSQKRKATGSESERKGHRFHVQTVKQW